MQRAIKFQEKQDKIYQKMSAKKKLHILDMFYQTAKVLNPKYFECRINRYQKRNFPI